MWNTRNYWINSVNNRYRTLPYDMIAKVMELDVEETEKKVFLDYLRGNKLNMEAKDKFSAFCEFVMKDEKKINRETGMGYPIILQDFHLEWCDLLQETPRLIIFSPRETGKSSLLSVAYPIWRLGNDPNLRIAIVSSASHQ